MATPEQFEDAKVEQWLQRDRVQWNGADPLYSDTLDSYFFSEVDVRDAIAERAGDSEALRFRICEPIFANEIDGAAHFSEVLPEDQPLDVVSPLIAEALEQFNAVIRSERAKGSPLSWVPGKLAATIQSTFAEGDQIHDLTR